MRGSGGDDEIVVLKLRPGFELHTLLCEVEADGFVHENFDVLVIAENGADGLRYLSGRKNGEGNLVEKRLECMVVSAIDQRDIDGKIAETHRCVDAAEASS
ncbi:hypothetical protein GCM10011507_20050 [Edaphobacter acidisoli]|uniref:Uncharacterized protein n=1 Tax=Edaphobacter acidisoli TaxID=2040573 RepID=A0A916W5K1_9BACT|nr:hypothetical protein GCM10011507_20050 [Edaphobacter acidisoli]